MGQPFEETWPQLLEKQSGTRTINVSMNGASNDWIARKVVDLVAAVNPLIIFIQWSYLHRREIYDPNLGDEARTLHYDSNDHDDYKNFFKNVDQLPTTVKIIHSWIPKYFDFHYDTDLDTKIYQSMNQRQLEFIQDVEQLDHARDGHHYDLQTSQKYVDHYLSYL
jgi:hypothetical protein